MEFTCDLNSLRSIANNVSFAINLKNSTIPVLEGILLECKDGNLKLTGYDLSLGIVKTLKVNQIKEGKVILKAQLLVEILKKLYDKTIYFKTDENLITKIKTTTTEYKISGINADEYPSLPEITEKNKISIKDVILKEAIFKTLFAVSINNVQNPILCGSLFKIKDDFLKIVSVDGYRVAISNSKIKNSNVNSNFVVSSKALNEILKLLKDEEDAETLIETDEKHAVFKINGYYLITRLLSGTFIDYKAAIPKSCKTIIKVNTQTLEQSLQKVSVLITQKISVIMKILEDEVCLQCESSLGKVEDVLKIKKEGEILEKIAFNNRFMLDALKHCKEEKILIGFNGPVMPIKIEPINEKSFLYLILPVRLK